MLVTCIPAAERQRSNRPYQLDATSSELVSISTFYHTSVASMTVALWNTLEVRSSAMPSPANPDRKGESQ